MDSIDWAALARLRAKFLAGNGGAADYWESPTDLASYDATFAQRIGWKWRFVLDDLIHRGWQPPANPTVLDWGCGTGIAARRYLGRWAASRVYLTDRSPMAMQFAARRIRETHPSQEFWSEPTPPRAVDVLLLSHVLTEQPEPWQLPCEATVVLIVEPGTRQTSQRLIALRERLRADYQMVAPCPHQQGCGLLGQDRDWCHQFAPTPPEIHQDRDWARFAQLTGIDLRRLPLSYLVLDQRPVPALPSGTVRVLGAPRVYKAHAQVLACTADGVRDYRLTKRHHPVAYRHWKKHQCDSFQLWQTEAGEIRQLQ